MRSERTARLGGHGLCKDQLSLNRTGATAGFYTGEGQGPSHELEDCNGARVEASPVRRLLQSCR